MDEFQQVVLTHPLKSSVLTQLRLVYHRFVPPPPSMLYRVLGHLGKSVIT